MYYELPLKKLAAKGFIDSQAAVYKIFIIYMYLATLINILACYSLIIFVKPKTIRVSILKDIRNGLPIKLF